MITVPVSHLKAGVKVVETIRSPRGGVLFNKKHVLTTKDLEVLHAFLVKYIQIDEHTSKQESPEQSSQNHSVNSLIAFFHHYERLYRMLIDAYRSIQSGKDWLNVMDIRTELTCLIKHIDVYNPCTFFPPPVQHCPESFEMRIAIMRSLSSYLLATALKMQEKDLMPITLGGLLCDVGLTKLMTATNYTTSEEIQADYRQHPRYGYDILGKIIGINEVTKLCALHHHEHIDGSGYPNGLTDQQIHINAKIVAVTDRFHNHMLKEQESNLSFHPLRAASDFLKENSTILDEQTMITFIKKITNIRPGVLVKLTDGRTAKIAFVGKSDVFKPVLELSGKLVYLNEMKNCHIDRVIIPTAPSPTEGETNGTQ